LNREKPEEFRDRLSFTVGSSTGGLELSPWSLSGREASGWDWSGVEALPWLEETEPSVLD